MLATGIPCLVLVDAAGTVISDTYAGKTYRGPDKVLADLDTIFAGGVSARWRNNADRNRAVPRSRTRESVVARDDRKSVAWQLSRPRQAGDFMFVDRIKVFAHAGNGGRGCVSFRREKFVPRGGPDGGDGGRGGDVILRADVHTDNLANLFYEPIIKAKSGRHGMGKKMHGKGAPHKVVNVPIGTVVFRAEAPLRESDG